MQPAYGVPNDFLSLKLHINYCLFIYSIDFLDTGTKVITQFRSAISPKIFCNVKLITYTERIDYKTILVPDFTPFVFFFNCKTSNNNWSHTILNPKFSLSESMLCLAV